jgi:glycosyltransferase involved in cell wall biosynthesis
MTHPLPTMDRPKVAFLHGRPGAHPVHQGYARAVGADFVPVDLRMRWQDQARSQPYIVASWLLNAITLPTRRDYDVFLVDGLHVGPVLMKRMCLRSNQKIVAHLASHTLYFLLTHQFARRVENLNRWALRNYDALICDGRMSVEIVEQLLGPHHPPIYENYGAALDAHAHDLAAVEPDLDAARMVFLGSGPGEFRAHYKGLDIMVDAFAIAATTKPDLHFDIIGDWDETIVRSLLLRVPAGDRERIHFLGAVTDSATLGRLLGSSALYVHCARGDAFPGSSIEAMMAGLVPLVSEWTGTRQLAERIDPRLVMPLDPVELARRIGWYFELAPAGRRALSDRSRAVAGPYTATAAAVNFAGVFQQATRELGLLAT